MKLFGRGGRGERDVTVGDVRVSCGRLIAEGGFSYVYEAANRSDTRIRYALKKILHQTGEQRQDTLNEVMALRVAQPHVNILELVAYGERSVSKGGIGVEEALLLFPLCAKGSLQGRIDAVNASGAPCGVFERVEELMGCFTGVCLAVERLHSIGLRHNDIKPGNILIADDGKNTPKLIDLGSVTPLELRVSCRREALEAQDVASVHSTAPYRAPELHETPSECLISGLADVFGLGCTLFAVAFGRNPFESPVEGFQKLGLLSGDITKSLPRGGHPWPQSLVRLITAMVRPSVDERLPLDSALAWVLAIGEGRGEELELEQGQGQGQGQEETTDNFAHFDERASDGYDSDVFGEWQTATASPTIEAAAAGGSPPTAFSLTADDVAPGAIFLKSRMQQLRKRGFGKVWKSVYLSALRGEDGRSVRIELRKTTLSDSKIHAAVTLDEQCRCRLLKGDAPVGPPGIVIERRGGDQSPLLLRCEDLSVAHEWVDLVERAAGQR